MKFTLSAAHDTLPHNANLHLWRKVPSPNCPLCSSRQTLLHVLNNCPVALQNRRYNHRHDAVLEKLHQFVTGHITPQQQVTVDLPDQSYSFPVTFAATDSRPDMVIWSQSSIQLIKLTIPLRSPLKTRQGGRGTGTKVYLLNVPQQPPPSSSPLRLAPGDSSTSTASNSCTRPWITHHPKSAGDWRRTWSRQSCTTHTSSGARGTGGSSLKSRDMDHKP